MTQQDTDTPKARDVSVTLPSGTTGHSATREVPHPSQDELSWASAVPPLGRPGSLTLEFINNAGLQATPTCGLVSVFE